MPAGQPEREAQQSLGRVGLLRLALAEQRGLGVQQRLVQVELQHSVLAGQPEQAGLPLPVREAQKSPAPEAPQRQEQAELSAGLPRPAPEAPLHQARAE